MKQLNEFVDRENKFGAIFGQPTLSLLIATDRQRIAAKIDAALSPENLTCDGELPRAEVQRRYNELMTAAKQLKKLDPAVTFYEYETEI